MKGSGWVKLHRQIFENKMWLSEPFTKAQAWVDLFANANHSDGSFWVRGIEVKVKRGEIGWSEITMSKRWRWSRMKVRRFLGNLEMDGNVRQQKIYKITSIIEIINYNKFQSDTTDETTERQQKDNRRDTNKNDKKKENEKKDTTEHSSEEINLLIKSFESLNPTAKKFYANTTQRKACAALIETYGLERMQKIVTETLPKTNGLQFFPVITTPLQLQDKYVALESAIRKYQSEKLSTKDKYKVI